jgi:hypothetical protein
MDVDHRRFLIRERYADADETNLLCDLQDEGLIEFGVGGRLGASLIRDVQPSRNGAEWLARAEQESGR